MNHHAIGRARARYGLELTGADLGMIRQMILSECREVTYLYRDSDFHFAVSYRGEKLATVADAAGNVITFLPRETIA